MKGLGRQGGFLGSPPRTCSLATSGLGSSGEGGSIPHPFPLPPLYFLLGAFIVTLPQLSNEETDLERGRDRTQIICPENRNPQHDGLCPLLAPPPLIPKISLPAPRARPRQSLLKRPQDLGGGELWVPFRSNLTPRPDGHFVLRQRLWRAREGYRGSYCPGPA